MIHTISMTHRSWERLKKQIVKDYGRTTIMISWRLKETLGFTIREHYDFRSDYSSRKPIRLDFYDEQLQTLFLLKYSDFVSDQQKDSAVV